MHGPNGNPALFRQPLPRFTMSFEPLLDFEALGVVSIRKRRQAQIGLRHQRWNNPGERSFGIIGYFAYAHLGVKRLRADSYFPGQLIGLTMLALKPFSDCGAYFVV